MGGGDLHLVGLHWGLHPGGGGGAVVGQTPLRVCLQRGSASGGWVDYGILSTNGRYASWNAFLFLLVISGIHQILTSGG